MSDQNSMAQQPQLQGEELLKLSLRLQESNERKHHDLSEVSIGNKTAEELVGDILTSESQDDDTAIAKFTSMAPDDIGVGLQDNQEEQKESGALVQGSPSFLSPSRLLSAESLKERHTEEDVLSASENPFEVADNNRNQMEEEKYFEIYTETGEFVDNDAD